METYIKLYDWMTALQFPDREVYAVIYQLTFSGNCEGYWGTTKALADRLNIPKKECRDALARLRDSGAVDLHHNTVKRQERRVYIARRDFADNLKDED